MLDIPAKWCASRKRWESHGGRYYFDPDAADHAADFFPTMLVHHIGHHAGLVFELLDYQRILIRAAFGWKRSADGLRRFRKIFLAIPKGNGKSPLCSGLGLYLAAFDSESGSEVYAVAGDVKQARVVFDTSRIMVESSPLLLEAFEVFRDSLKVAGGTSFYQVISAEAPGKHGFRSHGIIFDEFHTQPNRKLYEALDRNRAKRRQPMTIMATTAGDDDETICAEEWDYAKRLMAGEIKDEIYLPMIFEARKDEPWDSLEALKRVNPGWGVTLQPDALEQELLEAKNEPRKLNAFLQLHRNQWVNQAVAWIPVDRWDACEAAQFPDDEYLGGLQVAAGLDMAQKIDLCAFVATFREPLDGATEVVEVVGEEDEDGTAIAKTVSLNYRVYVVPFFWLPEERVQEREREGFASLRDWERAGFLTVTEGAVIDYDRIFRDIVKVAERFPRLKEAEIGFDPAFATELAQKLMARSFKMVEVLQNYKHLSEPSQVLEALIRGKRIQHSGHPVLRWNVENVAIRQDDAGRIRPVKPKKNAKKIDGVVASIMGLSRLMVQEEPVEQDWEVVALE